MDPGEVVTVTLGVDPDGNPGWAPLYIAAVPSGFDEELSTWFVSRVRRVLSSATLVGAIPRHLQQIDSRAKVPRTDLGESISYVSEESGQAEGGARSPWSK